MRRVVSGVVAVAILFSVAAFFAPTPVQGCIECEKCKHTVLLSRCWWVGQGETGRCECREFLNNCYASGAFCEIITITP